MHKHNIRMHVIKHLKFLMIISQDLNLCQPLRTLSDEDLEEMELKFYNSETHRAAFVLPQFAKKVGF